MKKWILLILLFCSGCAIQKDQLQVYPYESQQDNFQLIEEDYRTDAIERAALNATNLYFNEDLKKEDSSINLKVGLVQYMLSDSNKVSNNVDRAEVYISDSKTNEIRYGVSLDLKTLTVENAQRNFTLPKIVAVDIKENKEMIDHAKAWMERVHPDLSSLDVIGCYRADEYELTAFHTGEAAVVLIFSNEDHQLYSYSSGMFAENFLSYVQQGEKP